MPQFPHEVVHEKGLADFQAALANRALIDQAIGVLAERLGISVMEAAAVLTRHTANTGEALLDVVRAVLDGMNPDVRAADTRDMASSAMRAACAWAGLDAVGATSIRRVNNAVFALRRHLAVVKVMLSPALTDRAERSVAAARLFAKHGVPAVRLWPRFPQPVMVNGLAVTIWRYELPGGLGPTGVQLANLLLRLHELPLDDVILARWDPVADIRRRIALAQHACPEDLDFLSAECDRLRGDLADVRHVLPDAIVHGDAHLGNIIPTRAGPTLCDFDSTCIGPAESDLVPVAVGRLRFRDRSDTHDRLVDTYGFDVTTWDGFATLRRLRELKLVTSVLPNLGGNPRVQHEFRHRMRSIREGDDDTPWHRYS